MIELSAHNTCSVIYHSEYHVKLASVCPLCMGTKHSVYHEYRIFPQHMVTASMCGVVSDANKQNVDKIHASALSGSHPWGINK